jgi:hypothetical protein
LGDATLGAVADDGEDDETVVDGELANFSWSRSRSASSTSETEEGMSGVMAGLRSSRSGDNASAMEPVGDVRPSPEEDIDVTERGDLVSLSFSSWSLPRVDFPKRLKKLRGERGGEAVPLKRLERPSVGEGVKKAGVRGMPWCESPRGAFLRFVECEKEKDVEVCGSAEIGVGGWLSADGIVASLFGNQVLFQFVSSYLLPLSTSEEHCYSARLRAKRTKESESCCYKVRFKSDLRRGPRLSVVKWIYQTKQNETKQNRFQKREESWQSVY